MPKEEWNHWTDFFTVLAPIAATILGLLFVALQIAATTWDLVPLRHVAAYRHLIEIATPVGIGLVTLLPGGRWWLGGFIAGGIGLTSVFAYWFAYAYLIRLRKNAKNRYDILDVSLMSLLSVALYGAIILGSCLNDADIRLGLRVVGWACLWAVMAGVTQSWILLVVKAPNGGEEAAAKALKKAKNAADKAEEDARKARADADKARADADKARADADTAKAGAETAQLTVRKSPDRGDKDVPEDDLRIKKPLVKTRLSLRWWGASDTVFVVVIGLLVALLVGGFFVK